MSASRSYFFVILCYADLVVDEYDDDGDDVSAETLRASLVSRLSF